MINSYYCQCNFGSTGSHCQDLIDNCANNPCFNKGQCNNQIGSYTCACSWPYTGPTCQNYINACFSSPCVFGTCQAINDTFKCNCMNGQSLNLDSLYNFNNLFVYIQGYTGQFCDSLINYCASCPCLFNGTCIPLLNSYACQCSIGYSGTLCNIKINICSQYSCFNNGVCVPSSNTFSFS
jgi:hypothetical protein